MELRFLKGDWEFGKYKLQYRDDYKASFVDVPTINDEPKDISLEEKFRDWLNNSYSPPLIGTFSEHNLITKSLAEIAEKHFKKV